MSLRLPSLAVLCLCLCACLTLKPEESEYVPLSTALQVVARDLNQATPVVLTDIDKNQGAALKNAIKAFQCANQTADPPLFVITGSVSLQLQGSIQKQGGANAAPPYFQFQVQKTKAQQQQLTIPITFVAASALPNFFLGQNLTNVSTLPDLPDPKDPPKVDAKGAPPARSNGDGTRNSSDTPSPACVNTSCDKVTLGQDKASLQLALITKANAIRKAVTEQIGAVTDHSGAYAPPKDYCPKDQSVNFVLPAISVVLPQALEN
jgi:hypothetical protein